jgi:hypothetical protein
MGRHRFQSLGDHFLDLRVGDGPWGPRPRLIEQPFQAVDTESFAPLADGCPRDAKPLGHFAVTPSVTATEDNAGAHRKGLPGLWAPRQHSEFLLFLGGHIERFSGSTDGHTQVWTGKPIYSMYF